MIMNRTITNTSKHSLDAGICNTQGHSWAQANNLGPPYFTYAKYALLTAAYSKVKSKSVLLRGSFSSFALYRLHSPCPSP